MRGERSKGSARRPSAANKPAAASASPPRRGQLFAVTLSRGPAWNPEVPMEQQVDWDAHAAVMDALEAEGFIAIGGPLDDTPYVLLAIRAESPVAIRARLETDPWHMSRLLEISRIAPWTLRLGAGKV
jgi:uncharacterized protein YciI